jgi:hypothetical protein
VEVRRDVRELSLTVMPGLDPGIHEQQGRPKGRFFFQEFAQKMYKKQKFFLLFPLRINHLALGNERYSTQNTKHY